MIRAMSNAELRQAIDETVAQLGKRLDTSLRHTLEEHLETLLKVEACRAASITCGESEGFRPHQRPVP